MEVPLVDLKAQYALIKPEIDAAVQRVLTHTGFILGDEVANFERAFADYIGVREAVGVASGTAALRLALQACGVGPGDAVVTSAYTFFATAEAIQQVGATPIFVDIDMATYNLDPNCVEDVVIDRNRGSRSAGNGRVRAIIPVHLYGRPADMDPLLDIASRHELMVIEDAAQAHGAEYRGRRCGAMGHLGCFSFYPGKNLGAYGDAGMVTGNDEELLERVRRLRDHGRTSKHEHSEFGWGERLDALQAAVLLVKLPHLDAWTQARSAHARRYTELLDGGAVVVPYDPPDSRHAYHLYVIRSQQRDDLLAHLRARGIGAGVHYPIPLHRQPAMMRRGWNQFSLPTAEQAAAEVISLPLYPELTDNQTLQVVEAVTEFYSS